MHCHASPCKNDASIVIFIFEKTLMVDQEILTYEKEIIWLVDLNDYPWVREHRTDFTQRQGISKARSKQIANGQKIIGYADLSDDAPPSFTSGTKKHYYRRIFVVRDGDYEAYIDGHPVEAVDPMTVQPKTKGTSPKKKLKLR